MVLQDKFNFKELYIHVAFWFIYYFLQHLFDNNFQVLEIPYWKIYLTSLIFFYALAYFFINYSIYKKPINYTIIGSLICTAVFIYVTFYLKMSTKSLTGGENYYNINLMTTIDDAIKTYTLAFIYAAYKTVIINAKRIIETEKNKHQVEINYLNNQIDQHFFYNYLSMIYLKSLDYSAILSEKIIKLADILSSNIKSKNY